MRIYQITYGVNAFLGHDATIACVKLVMAKDFDDAISKIPATRIRYITDVHQLMGEVIS